MADSCAQARERLVKETARLRPASRAEKAGTAVKAAFLGSIVTPLRALGGNSISLGFRTLVQHPLEVGFDYIRAVGKAASADDLTLTPHQYREIVWSLDREGLGTLWRGAKKGAAPTVAAARAAAAAGRAEQGGIMAQVKAAVVRFSTELSVQLDAEGVERVLEHRETRYTNDVSDAVVNTVLGAMEAVDRPYWRAAYDFSMYTQSKAMAAAQGLSKDRLQSESARLFATPTDEMVFRASDHANYITFRNKNLLSKAASTIKQGVMHMAEKAPTAKEGTLRYDKERVMQGSAKALSVGLDVTVPFTGVPSAIAGQSSMLSAGPLSLVRLLMGKRHPVEQARIVSEAAVGTALIAAGYQLAAEGLLTTALPDTEAEREQFEAEGRKPWSIRIGKEWIDIRPFMPIMAPLFTGAAMRGLKQNDTERTKSERSMAAVGTTMKMLTQQVYLETLDRAISTLKLPGKNLEKVGEFVVSTIPIPSVLGQVARSMDDTERRPDGALERLRARLPGLSQLNPVAVDALGRDPSRSAGERIADVFSPLRGSQSRENDVTKEFARLGISLTRPEQSSTLGGVKYERSGKEYEAYLRQVGAAKEQALREYITSTEYRGLTDQQKAIVLLDIQDRVHDWHRQMDVGRMAQKSLTTPRP